MARNAVIDAANKVKEILFGAGSACFHFNKTKKFKCNGRILL
jgi:hypothetical protein